MNKQKEDILRQAFSSLASPHHDEAMKAQIMKAVKQAEAKRARHRLRNAVLMSLGGIILIAVGVIALMLSGIHIDVRSILKGITNDGTVLIPAIASIVFLFLVLNDFVLPQSKLMDEHHKENR